MGRTLAAVVLCFVSATTAGQTSQPNYIPGTGTFYLKMCQEPALAGQCTMYMFAYMQGVHDGQTETGSAWVGLEEGCQKGNKAFCVTPREQQLIVKTTVDSEYNGCNGAGSRLPQTAIQQLIIASLVQHPERTKWDYGSIYRKAIEDAFPCTPESK